MKKHVIINQLDLSTTSISIIIWQTAMRIRNMVLRSSAEAYSEPSQTSKIEL